MEDFTNDGFLAAAFGQAPVAMCVLRGPEHRFVFANGPYEDLVAGRALLGRTVREALPEIADQGFYELLDGVYATGEPVYGKATPVGLVRPDGTPYTVYVDFSYTAVRDAAGAVAGVFAHVFDVTEAELARRAADAELERQKGLMALIVDHAPAAIAFIDREGVVRQANPAYLAMVGIPAERMIGRHVTEVFGPGFEAQFGEIWRRIYATRTPYVGQAFPFTYERDGHAHQSFWDFSHVPVIGPDGEPVGILNLSMEVSDRVRAEQLQRAQIAHLEEADRLKNQFLGVLSHELRTPLNAIQGFGSILEDEIPGPLNPVQRGYVGKILEGSDRMLLLVNDLLDMSRILAGMFTVTPQPTPFAPIVREVLASLAPLAEAQRLAVTSELPKDLPPVLADDVRVAQVVSNLVTNALKFVPPGGHVAVRAWAEGGSLRCEVADDGPGIDPRDHEHVFRSFTQADMSETRRHGGVGLGLAICKSLVEAHGGEIGLESAAGEGATFWFTLPLAAVPSEVAS